MPSITAGVGQNNGGANPGIAIPASLDQQQQIGMQGKDTNDYGNILSSSPLSQDAPPGYNDWLTQQLKNNTLSPTNLLPGQRNLSPETQGLINDQITQGRQDPYAQWTQGIDQSNFLNNSQQMGLNQTSLGLGGDSGDAFSQALARNNSNNYNDSMTALKSNLAFQAPQNQMAQMNQISGELGMNEQLKNKNYQEQYQYMINRRAMDNQAQMAQNQQRAGVLSGVIGGVASVVGALL